MSEVTQNASAWRLLRSQPLRPHPQAMSRAGRGKRRKRRHDYASRPSGKARGCPLTRVPEDATGTAPRAPVVLLHEAPCEPVTNGIPYVNRRGGARHTSVVSVRGRNDDRAPQGELFADRRAAARSLVPASLEGFRHRLLAIPRSSVFRLYAAVLLAFPTQRIAPAFGAQQAEFLRRECQLAAAGLPHT